MYVLCIVYNFINGQDNILFSMVAISMSLILTGTSYGLSLFCTLLTILFMTSGGCVCFLSPLIAVAKYIISLVVIPTSYVAYSTIYASRIFCVYIQDVQQATHPTLVVYILKS